MAAPLLGDLISESFYEIGVYSPGDTVDPIHINFGGVRLNSMIDAFKVERLIIYREQRTGPFNLVANTQTYFIGSGATWNTARPTWIDFAGLLDITSGASPTPEYPIHIFNDDEWARIVQKGRTSTLPTAIWYDRTYDSARGTINVYPVPTLANQIVLYSPVPVGEFTLPDDLTEEVSFPPGYRDFLMYHLAIRLAPTFHVTPSELTLAQANLAMEKVKISNLRIRTLRVDPALISTGGAYNVFNDSFISR